MSIVFLVLVLLNTIGYYGLLTFARTKSSSDVIRKIDENAYAISGNMILRVPLSLPYASNAHAYEAAGGEIAYGGEVFHLVKRRIYNDTLYIVCVRDYQTTQVNQTIADYLRSFGTPSSDKNSGMKLMMFAKDYIITTLHSRVFAAPWFRVAAYRRYSNAYTFTCGNAVFHPPEIILSTLFA